MNLDQFKIQEGVGTGGQRIVVVGTGGIGKTTLLAQIPNTLVLDIENGARSVGVKRIANVTRLDELRAILQSKIVESFDNIFIDSGTKAEELAVAHVLANVPNEKGQAVNTIEGYGWGKGYSHVYDTFTPLLADLDRLAERGKNVGFTAHICTSNVPNPIGDDFIRYEPRLQNGKEGKHSIRNRVVEWADHVFFIGYDVIAKDGKARGNGSRMIYTQERPTHIAKSRTLNEIVPFEHKDDTRLWQMLFGAAWTGGAS